MSLKITKNVAEANLITHSSTFHPDDVFATMFLAQFISDPVVCRVNEVPDNIRPEAIVYDIGYGQFDHHGPNAKMRNAKIKYCSFGLLWAYYGKDYLKTKTNYVSELWQAIDEKLIMQIDGIDNGLFPKIEAEYSLIDLDKVIDLFNKAWNEDIDNDENFMLAVAMAEKIFKRLLVKENAKIEASLNVAKYIPTVKEGILFLPIYMPYQEAIFASTDPLAETIRVVIFPSNRGGYNIKPRTKSKDTKELVCNFPSSWWGLHDAELQNVSHIPTASFIHASGFLACSENLEDAYKLAQIAIQNNA